MNNFKILASRWLVMTFATLVLLPSTHAAFATSMVATDVDDQDGQMTIKTHAANTAPTATPRPKKKSADDLTKAALRRAHSKKNTELPEQDEAVTSGDQVGPIIVKPVVKSQAAPGTTPTPSATIAAPSSATTAAAPTAPVETTPEKARELIMTSSAHVGADPAEQDDAGEESAALPTTLKAPATGPLVISPASAGPPAATAAGAATSGHPPMGGAVEPPAGPKVITQNGDVALAKPSATTKNLAADRSLQWLVNGNSRYISGRTRRDGQTEQDRVRISKTGQKPHAIVLSCADSAVPPELVFDQALGELYTVRTLGEVTDAASLASLEYAVTYLGPQLLVVMGHTQCDAVQGVLQLKASDNAGSRALNQLLGDIRTHLQTFNNGKPSPSFAVESTLNADGVARDLVNRSDIIRKKVESGELVIKTALYRGESGKVTFY